MNEKKFFNTKTKYIYDSIRDDIINGRYKPDDKLIIGNIAEELKTSDIPVREALRKLESEKLVTFSPHIGVKVAKISYDEMKEIMDLRALLESHAVYLAAKQVTDDLIVKLKELLRSMKKCLDSNDYKAYGKLNREFHLDIYEICGNKTLYNLIKEMMEKTERSRAVFKIYPSRMQESYEEHRMIIEALEQKNAQEAKKIIYSQRNAVKQQYVENIDNIVSMNGT
jgi:DNA-binding GntR family transcriptional regulator